MLLPAFQPQALILPPVSDCYQERFAWDLADLFVTKPNRSCISNPLASYNTVEVSRSASSLFPAPSRYIVYGDAVYSSMCRHCEVCPPRSSVVDLAFFHLVFNCRLRADYSITSQPKRLYP